MQITPAATSSPVAPGLVLASQTIDIRSVSNPPGGVTMWSTEREFRLAGAREGIDTYTSLQDAISAARQLSAGDMPGLAVVQFRGGFRVHDVHATSRTYLATSTHGAIPPSTRLTGRSSVPFAAGNIRAGEQAATSTPAVVRSDRLAALVDGERVFLPFADRTWAGRPRLVEVTRP